MPSVHYAIQLNDTTFRYAVLKALPIDVRRSTIKAPVLLRNTAKFYDGCAIKLGALVITDLERNELLIEARQTGVLVGHISVCHIKDGQECRLNHLLGKSVPGLPEYV